MQQLFDPARLAQILERLGAAPAPGLFVTLAELYGAPDRHYHSGTHVAECLRALDAHRELAERPDEVELAIWFHDAIYDSRRGDNAEASARLAGERLEPLGVPGDALERI
ncbi:MAG: HD domain-containing protein, partial [Planctomycetota bacterium]